MFIGVLVELVFGNAGFYGVRKLRAAGEKHSEQGENEEQTQPAYGTSQAHIGGRTAFQYKLVMISSWAFLWQGERRNIFYFFASNSMLFSFALCLGQ